METYLISYDLHDSGADEYDSVFDYIKSYSAGWAYINESLWAIKTNKSAVVIRDELYAKTNKKSRIFVIKSGIEAAWSNVICSNQWLKDNL
jgi:hypothetical protein